MSQDIKKSCSFKILILTTVVQPGYCHFKSCRQPSADVVMLCFGLMMLHPPPIHQFTKSV